MDITKLYQTQISLTEWFALMGHGKTEALRREDNDKRERLAVLNSLIGLPYDKPHQFKAIELVERSAAFDVFLAEHGHELCALRLIPLNPELPKLRMRGHTVREAMTWFQEQNINARQYKADFVPHAEHSKWSTIFVVNQHGVFGEVIEGGHHQLTQGFYGDVKPLTFAYDFKDWQLSSEQPDAEAHVKEVVGMLKVDDDDIRQRIVELFNAEFASDYLCGYFETAASDEFGAWFIDYNRVLGDIYKDFTVSQQAEADNAVHGQIGSPGKATGKVRVVREVLQTISNGEVLVCAMTTPEFVPLMGQAAAIVTDLGGILSHAAIIARELGKPCIVGTQNATMMFKDGDVVEVDADKGVVRKI